MNINIVHYQINFKDFITLLQKLSMKHKLHLLINGEGSQFSVLSSIIYYIALRNFVVFKTVYSPSSSQSLSVLYRLVPLQKSFLPLPMPPHAFHTFRELFERGSQKETTLYKNTATDIHASQNATSAEQPEVSQIEAWPEIRKCQFD